MYMSVCVYLGTSFLEIAVGLNFIHIMQKETEKKTVKKEDDER